MAIAATARDSDAYDVGRAIAQEGRAVGIHINFAPVVDVNNNPANPVINTRSFGEDPQRVARLSALFVRGTQDGGELATAKHFPGHGDTDVDSHVGLPIVSANSARLDSVELVPFKAAIAAGASLVMTAHIALPAIQGDSSTPATLAPRIITGLLRDTLGFRGVAITDAMTMEGIGKGYTTEQSSVLAVKAGADILLKPSDPTRAIDAVVAAVERGEISRARIDSAVRHVLELKVRSGAAPNGDRFARAIARRRRIAGASRDRGERCAAVAHASSRSRQSRADRRRTRAACSSFATRRRRRSRRARHSRRRLRAGAGARGIVARRSTSRALGPAPRAICSIRSTRAADAASTVIVTAYVRRVEGQGRVAVPQSIATWIEELSRRHRTVVVAFGNPYLIGQFPSVGSFLAAYSVSDDLERAAANALLGRARITGRAPISLPGVFKRGDGLTR